MNRQVFPASLFPLRGDISAESGATSVTVIGIQGIPVISPPVEPAGLDTFFYDSYNNDWFYASPWDIPVGIPLVWEGYGYGSSGISWIAPDTLAFGNGTDGDVSGAAAMTALVLFGSASYYGPYNDYDVDYGPSYDQFYTSIFSGATQNWNLILPPNPGTSGQVLTTNGTGVTYWSTISGGGGGSVTSFSSGSLSPLFTTSVATPTTTPALSFSLNTQNANTVFAGPVSGGAATPTFRALVSADIPVPGSTGDILYNNGGVLGASLSTITAAGSITIPDTQVLLWGGAAYSGVGLSQLAADTLAVGNGTESDVSGGMAMTALVLFGSASYYGPYHDYDVDYGPSYDQFYTSIFSGATQNWALVLPETSGNAGQVLVNIGSGVTSWESLTTLGVPWSALTNPTANLSLTMGTDTTTFNYATGLAAAWIWQNNTPTVTGASTTVALSTSTAPTHVGSVFTYTLAASESGAGSNAWVGASVTTSGWTGGAAVNNGTFTITASTTTTVSWTNASGTTTNTGTPVMISSAVSSSPVLQIAGTVNTGTAGTLNSVADTWSVQNVIGSVVPNPTSTLTFTHAGSSGVASVQVPAGTAGVPGLSVGAAGVGLANSSSNLQLCTGTATISLYSIGATFGQLTQSANFFQIHSSASATGVEILGNITNTAVRCIALGNANTLTTTSGAAIGCDIGGYSVNPFTFTPASGSATFVACNIGATIEGTSSGATTCLVVNPTITTTNLTGANLIAAFQSAGANETTIDYSGNIQCAGAVVAGSTTVSSPSAGFFYSGSSKGITQTAEAVGTLATTGGIVTTFTAVSDERLKDFFEYDGGLAEVLEITPIRYRWNETGVKYSGQSTERDFIGFSAQNVRKVIPEAVWVSKDDYLGFDDRPVIAAAVCAIKELHAIIKKQDERIEQLEEKLDSKK